MITCEYCNALFASRNLIFKHLRDESNECGAKVKSLGGIGKDLCETAKEVKKEIDKVKKKALTHGDYPMETRCRWLEIPKSLCNRRVVQSIVNSAPWPASIYPPYVLRCDTYHGRIEGKESTYFTEVIL
jgi:hypothetical protein